MVWADGTPDICGQTIPVWPGRTRRSDLPAERTGRIPGKLQHLRRRDLRETNSVSCRVTGFFGHCFVPFRSSGDIFYRRLTSMFGQRACFSSSCSKEFLVPVPRCVKEGDTENVEFVGIAG